MPFVGRRNVDRQVRDVAHPQRDPEEEAKAIARAEFMRARAPRDPEIESGPGISIRKFVIVFLSLVVVTLIAIGIQVYRTQNEVARSMRTLDDMSAALPALRDLRIGDARDQLAAGLGGVGSSGFQISSFGDFVNLVGDLFRGAGDTLGSLESVSGNLSGVVTDVDQLLSTWPDLLFGDRGPEFVALLSDLESHLDGLNNATADLAGMNEELRRYLNIDASQFLDLRIEVEQFRKVLQAGIPLVAGPEERRFAIFLLNPAEMRPGGGFLGSYAEAVIRDGSVRDVVVRDVNEADQLLERKIVPPQPLQGIVKQWRAADANWFFDFASSSEKTLSLLESSQLYAPDHVRFEGAIGVTGFGIARLLTETGPLTVTVSSTERTIDSDNVLTVIQEEVQAGQAASAPEPKAILKALAPAIIERLRAVSATDQNGLAGLLQDLARTRDLVFYARDGAMESFLDSLGATGRVYQPAEDPGDYLAVVRANVGGGKSDLFLNEQVTLQSQIAADGTVNDHLEIARAHRAGKDEPWWYRETNESFTKVFVPASSRLLAATGTEAHVVKPQLDYAKAGYETDLDVAAQEASRVSLLEFPDISTYREYGKAAFAFWTRTKASSTTATAFDYEHRLIDPPSASGTYRFVLERQPGSQSSYRIELSAPPGFRWKENGLPVYEYDADSPDGRTIIDLTFERIPGT